MIMEYEVIPKEEGSRIKVETDKKAAVVVRSSGKERIYLPSDSVKPSSYYSAPPSNLVKTQEGYEVFHEGELEEVEIFLKDK